VFESQQTVERMLSEWRKDGGGGACPFPDEPLRRVPVPFGVINVWVYGMSSWGDLFTARQKLAVSRLAELMKVSGQKSGTAVGEALALTLGKVLRHCNVVSKWHRGSETVAGAFGMQAIPMSWDFPEMFPMAAYAGGLDDALEDTMDAIAGVGLAGGRVGQVQLADAAKHPLPDDSASVWFTDPPYYDAVPYSYLSDFFYVWLRRTIGSTFPQVFSNDLSPKENELVAYVTEGSPVTAYKVFEERMARAFSEGRRVLQQNGVGSVVFAHKTTEGWEALLSGMHQAGWTITSSWPVATERGARLRARDSAALATSVHLMCRPRPADAPVGDWADVFRELPQRVRTWMERLQSEGVRGADLVFACIGPALEIYTRHAKVVDANDREIPLGGNPEATEPYERGYLTYVWEVVGRTALEQVLGQAESKAKNGASAALEEDARLTALFLWTLQSTTGTGNGSDGNSEEEDEEAEEDAPAKKRKGVTLPYDVVRRFAQPLGIHLERWQDRIVDQHKGVVRLLPVSERADQLFGEGGPQAVALELERSPVGRAQITLFPDAEGTPRPQHRKGKAGSVSKQTLVSETGATTLDRVHAAMLLQRAGKTQALRRLLTNEQDRGPDFLRLANALSALYPSGSDEERLLDAMLLAVPR